MGAPLILPRVDFRSRTPKVKLLKRRPPLIVLQDLSVSATALLSSARLDALCEYGTVQNTQSRGSNYCRCAQRQRAVAIQGIEPLTRTTTASFAVICYGATGGKIVASNDFAFHTDVCLQSHVYSAPSVHMHVQRWIDARRAGGMARGAGLRREGAGNQRIGEHKRPIY